MIPAEYPLPSARAAMQELQRTLEQFRSRQRARYGIYVEDLNTGLKVNLGGDEAFTAGGTAKFPACLYAFHQASVCALDMEMPVEYQPADRTSGTGVIQNAPFGSRYTLRQVCYHALVDADNTAWRMLYRILGETEIKDWLRSIGGQQVVAGQNLAAPADYAVYFKFLLDFASRQPGLGGTLLEWLKKSGYPTWASRSLPRAVPMAHVTGAVPTAVSDVGLVFLPRAPYLLCAMTDLKADQRQGFAIDNLAWIGATVFGTLRPLAGKFAAVSLNGRPVAMRLPGALVSGHLMVHLADMAQAIGARVRSDGGGQTLDLERGSARVHLSVGGTEMQADGETRTLPVAPFSFEGHILAPLRPIAEALGARVDWDPDRYRALLTI
jgi:beta-lactamase class A